VEENRPPGLMEVRFPNPRPRGGRLKFPLEEVRILILRKEGILGTLWKGAPK